MYSHTTVGTNDFKVSKAFYDAVLGTLGIACFETSAEHGFAGYARDPMAPPQFFITRPFDRAPASVGNGMMIAFHATERRLVDAFHAAGLAAGGTDEGAPGLRPHYHPDYYGAYLRDPDGNKICVACHAPAPS